MGQVKSPELLFWSGDKVVVYRDVEIPRGSTTNIKLFMIPDEFTLKRYDIKDKYLFYDDYGIGTIVKEYPSEYVHKLTGNPENPQWLCLCNFDGSLKVDVDIQKVLQKNTMLRTTNNELIDENSRLHETIKNLIEKINDLRNKIKV